MYDRWNLITNKKTFEPQRTISKEKSEGMVNLEEEKFADERNIEKLYERKKRNFSELGATGGSKQKSNSIQLVPYSKGNTLHVKNVDNISNFTDGTLKPKSFKIEDTKIPKSESTKIFAYESIEKFLYMDEKFIDADRTIGYGGISSGMCLFINYIYSLREITK